MAGKEYRLGILITLRDKMTLGLEKMNSAANKTKASLDKLNKAKVSPTIKLNDKISAAATKIEAKLKSLGSTASGVISKLTSPIALFGVGAATVGGSMLALDLAGDMEQAQMGMEFFMGSAEKGQKAIKDLITFAAKTPFEFPFLQESAIGLMGVYKGTMDVDAAWKETIRDLRAFGDAAGYTGAGMEGMKLAMLGFKQIGYVGTLQMEELRQVSENLRVPMSELGKALGVSSDQLKEIGSLGIPASKAMNKIVTYLEQSYAGGMEKLSSSYLGLKSTVKDTARFVVAALGTGMAGPVKRILADITGSTDFTSESFQTFLSRIQASGDVIGAKFESVYNKIKSFYTLLSSDSEFQKADFGGKIIIAVNKGLNALKTWLDGEGGTQISSVMNTMGELFARSLTALIPVLTPVAESLGIALGKGILSGIKAALGEAAKSDWGNASEFLLNANVATKYSIPNITYNLAQKANEFISKKATGDIVTRPTYSLIGEAGPEAIIPLSGSRRTRGIQLWQQAGQMLGVAGAGGLYVNANVNVAWDADEDALAMRIGRQIVQQIKQAIQNK